MRLRVVTPEGSKVDAQVTSVTAPGAIGELGILPGHRPLLTSLVVGKLSYLAGGQTHHLASNEGFLEVHDDEITVVTESAEEPDRIDVARSRAALAGAERDLGEIDPREQPEAFKLAQERKARALNRLRVAELHATPDALRKVRAKGEAG